MLSADWERASPEVGMQAWRWVRLWFGLDGPVDRRTYVLSGIGLAVLKYAVEVGLVRAFTARWLSPIEGISPSLEARADMLSGAPEWLGWALFLWSMPFVWISISMSVRRAAAAGVNPWLGVLMLVPTLNLVMIVILACLPDRQAAPAAAESRQAAVSEAAAATRAIAAAIGTGILSFLVSIYGFGEYGAVLFLGTPLVMGMVAGFLFNRPTPRSTLSTTALGAGVMALAGATLVALAFEGMICLLMAIPLVMPLTIAGTLLGKWIAEGTRAVLAHALPLVLALPLMAGAESLRTALPEYEVLTSVVVDAPPAAVWRHVVEFPDLPEPTDWFFRSGVACPMRARIEGSGVGAVRHCEFSTGDFVEPITAWDEPRLLAFDVREQPDPMVELSPWRHVHPPHIHDRSLQSRRGEFRLVDLGGGRTRLEGRTWYTFDMHPQAYWTAWAHGSIHKIHRRVLDHIKTLAEAPPD